MTEKRKVYVNSTLAQRKAERLAAEDTQAKPEPEPEAKPEPQAKAIQKADNKAIQHADTDTK